jgi:hypothetical protein
VLGRWSFEGDALEEIWLVPSFGGTPPPAEAARLDPEAASLRLDTWSFRRSLSRSTLTEIVQHLEPHLRSTASAEIAWLRDRIDDALRSRRLTAYVLYRAIASSGAAALIEATPVIESPPPPKETTTWIAIQLRNKKGEAVAFKRYRIELPDGSRREGMLDAKGLAGVDGIAEPGMCQVSFPEFDATEWRSA